jgi:hypothetical protein
VSAKRSEVLWWLRRGRERAKWIEAEAEALVRDVGVNAYAEARRLEREANSIKEARDCNRIALATARRTYKAVGIDAASRIASDAIFALYFRPSDTRACAAILDPVQVVEPTGNGSFRPPAQ